MYWTDANINNKNVGDSYVWQLVEAQEFCQELEPGYNTVEVRTHAHA